MSVSKKIKWALMIAAIILGIGGAILTRSNANASKDPEPFYAAEGCVSVNTGLPAIRPVH
ncbi:MAG TPA: hypothetical protein VGS79_06220 [Puia sp.]|nr:hypothetical protein [Puia sp.]